jgi:glucokinase
MSDKHWIGFDLGGTKIMALAFDGDFKVAGRKRRKTKAYEGVESGVDRIVKTVGNALEDAGIDKSRLAGIGAGCPGPLDLEKGVIMEAPNLGWSNVRLKERLEKEFGCPAVIANDVDCGVYAEYSFGAAQKANCVLGVFPGTGIGAGCIYKGRLIQGENTSCMELGHIPVVPDGALCGCGQRGCLETVASRLAISSAAATAAYRGQAPHLLERCGTDMAEIRSGALAAAIENGDAIIEDIVRHAAQWLGHAIAIAINLLAPDKIVLGGGLVEAMPKLFVAEVDTSARKRVLPIYANSFNISAAKMGDDATATGAAAWARAQIEP